MPQVFVRFAGVAARKLPQLREARRHNLPTMNKRFLSDRRATWRQRFLDIARQAGAAGAGAPVAASEEPRPRPRIFPSAAALRVRGVTVSSH